eukprot:jgi/Psemu1/311941/fgenesh1_kg.857_\
MVILETAAIGAAGYGLYKGGEAGVSKAKDCHKELQRERVRASQRSSLNQKTRARHERISAIINMKKNGGATNSSSSIFGLSTATLGNNSAGSDNAVTSYAARRKAESEASSEIDDRHRAVMKKVAFGRQEERKKGTKLKKLQSLNPFKKK